MFWGNYKENFYSFSSKISSEFVFCEKKRFRNQCSFINAHDYKSQRKLFLTHESKTYNTFFLKLAFCNFDLWNGITRHRIELLRQFFVQNTLYSLLHVMPWKSRNHTFPLHVWFLRSHHMPAYILKHCNRAYTNMRFKLPTFFSLNFSGYAKCDRAHMLPCISQHPFFTATFGRQRMQVWH